MIPEIVTGAPIGPDAGAILEILGVGITVKLIPLLANPFTVTTIVPELAADGTGTIILPVFQV
ncbi:MAG: hypothetical protein WAK20_02615, partial [Candidatus Acidiferrum sp.]